MFYSFFKLIEISIYLEYNSNNKRSYNFSFLVDNCSLNNLLHHLITNLKLDLGTQIVM